MMRVSNTVLPRSHDETAHDERVLVHVHAHGSHGDHQEHHAFGPRGQIGALVEHVHDDWDGDDGHDQHGVLPLASLHDAHDVVYLRCANHNPGCRPYHAPYRDPCIAPVRRAVVRGPGEIVDGVADSIIVEQAPQQIPQAAFGVHTALRRRHR